MLCPCQVNNSDPQQYDDCCQPFHLGQHIPNTAEQLMRSRYSAYVLQNIDYIIKTTLPAQQPLLNKKGIANWSKQTDWAGLSILKHINKVGKRHAQVEFKAHFYDADKHLQAHHELSTFVKTKNKKTTQADSTNQAQWYFIDPTVQMTVSQKQPCICGSGDKFKRCCGAFL